MAGSSGLEPSNSAPSGRSQEDSQEFEFETEPDATVKTASLLDRRKCPSHSVLSRTHEVYFTHPQRWRKRSTGEWKLGDPDVPLFQCMLAGRLFGKACREVLSVTRSNSRVKCESKREYSKVSQRRRHSRGLAKAWWSSSSERWNTSTRPEYLHGESGPDIPTSWCATF